MTRRKRLSSEICLSAAYLATCSPDAAYDWLARLSPDLEVSKLEEEALFNRRHPLIDLGLAQYAHDPDIVGRIFARGGEGIRVAAWSNKNGQFSSSTEGLSTFSISNIISSGIWANEEHVESLVSVEDAPELIAFAANPSVRREVLKDIVCKTGQFASLSVQQYANALIGLVNNPQVIQGWGPVKQIWKLAAKLPVEEEQFVEYLLSNLQTTNISSEEVWPMIERWRLDKTKIQKDDKHDEGPTFNIRTRLADLLEADDSLRHSDDLALRLSYFRRFNPYDNPAWEEDVRQEFAKGNGLAIYAALDNPNLIATKDMRNKLRALVGSAWGKYNIPRELQVKERILDEQSYADDFNGDQPPAPKPALPDTPEWAREILNKLENSQYDIRRLLEAADVPNGRLSPDVPTKSNKTSQPVLWWTALICAFIAGHYFATY